MRWQTKVKPEWEPFFAWHPVDTEEGLTIWWEWVEMKTDYLAPDAMTQRTYRMKRDNGDGWLTSAVEVMKQLEKKRKK